MSKALRILILDDEPNDVELEIAEIEGAGYSCEWDRVEKRDDFLECINAQDYDLILSEYKLTSFDGLTALNLILERKIDIPFIFLSSTPGEVIAVESLKVGATDYVMKTSLSRLGLVVNRALREKEKQRRYKQAEVTLRKSEKLFRNLVQTATDAIITINLDGTVMTFNQAAEHIFGYSVKEVIGKEVTILMPEDYREQHRHGLHRYRECKPSKVIGQTVELEGLRKNGEIFPLDLSLSVTLFNEDKTITGIIRDITERKRNEKEKKNLQHNMEKRIKELQCMYNVTESIRKQKNVKNILQNITKIIPQGWQYPENTRAKIIFDDREYISEPFTETEWKLSSNITIGGTYRGSILVYYLKECWESGEDPFMIEEQHLLDGISENIGEVINRKQVEKAHRDSESRFDNLFENAEISIWNEDLSEIHQVLKQFRREGVTDLRRYLNENLKIARSLATKVLVIGVNKTTLKMFGSIGKNKILHQIENTFHKNAIKVFIEELCAIWEGKSVFRSETTFMGLDGKEINAIISFRIPESDEDFKSVPISVIDITERKRSEIEMKKLSLAIEQSPVSVVITDEKANIEYLNRAFCETTGYSEEELVGKNSRVIQGGKTPKKTYEELWKTLLSGKVWRGVLNNRKKNGELFWEKQAIVAIRNDHGDITNYLAVKEDITEFKKLEADLKKERNTLVQRVKERTADLSIANAKLIRAASMKDEFLAGMSHELRTPLTVILGVSESLAEGIYGDINAKQYRQVSIIEESGRHLLNLINDILDLSKVEAGKMELEMDQVNISYLCDASIQFVKAIADKKGIKVSLSINSTSTKFNADERRMKQILINLLTNAVKFTPKGNTIGLDVSEDTKHHVIHFSVWDTGIGIADEDLKKLFIPFVQLDGKLSREFSGTGLGLSLVSGLTDLHRGGVAVKSELGKGSRFTVSIPSATLADISILTKSQIFCVRSQQVYHALIAEDSHSETNQIVRYLSNLNITSTICSTGKEVVELIIKKCPDLIILDLQLPDISGWEVLKHLKEEKKTKCIPVLIVSVIDERSKGLSLGATDYLVKPITRNQFEQKLYRIFPEQFELSGAETILASSEQAENTGLSPLILLVEDNENNIEMLSDYLITKNYKVIVARNGKEGVDRAREIKPSVILMDIQMPVMDGLEAIKEIRDNERKILKVKNAEPEINSRESESKVKMVPIIALTGLAMRGDRERCLEAGANDYVSKPLKMEELVDKISVLLQNNKP